jgi:hypothetical protein
MKILIISYVSWGGQFEDKKHLWRAMLDNEVYDWGTKEQHIKTAKENGWNFMVLRTHRNGTTSIKESNL